MNAHKTSHSLYLEASYGVFFCFYHRTNNHNMTRLPFTNLSEKQDLSHKSHNAPNKYPTMHYFVTEMCTCVHISVTNWCIVGYGTVASWDLIQYIEITYLQYHFISNTEHKYIILQKFSSLTALEIVILATSSAVSDNISAKWNILCQQSI